MFIFFDRFFSGTFNLVLGEHPKSFRWDFVSWCGFFCWFLTCLFLSRTLPAGAVPYSSPRWLSWGWGGRGTIRRFRRARSSYLVPGWSPVTCFWSSAYFWLPLWWAVNALIAAVCGVSPVFWAWPSASVLCYLPSFWRVLLLSGMMASPLWICSAAWDSVLLSSSPSIPISFPPLFSSSNY